MRQKLQEKDKKIVELEAQLEALRTNIPIRWLEMYDHRPLLEQALKDRQNRLMIISPSITAKSVNAFFLNQLENLLKKEVKVFIGYGLGEQEGKPYPKDIEAQKKLQALKAKYANFCIFKCLEYKPKIMEVTHSKVLISDNKFAVVTSFNWLSFQGSKDRTFRDERGTFVAFPPKVDELFDNLAKMLNNES